MQPKFEVGDKVKLKNCKGVMTVKKVNISYELEDSKFTWEFNENDLLPAPSETKRYFLNIRKVLNGLPIQERIILLAPLKKYDNTEFIFSGINSGLSEQNKDGIMVLKAWCDER